MASKQLGKLRQWAGEVISSREKTVLSDEFQELEKDIELRRSGNERLYFACDAYNHALKKKKDCLALDDPEKLLPIDILGIVMITHGEEFGDSVFGTSLVKLGRAHCKVATLQEGYALTFRDTYMASIEKFGDEIKEYDSMRKKLDSRRLSFDAALSKADKLKTSKKDKDRKDAEVELETAQARYEEAMEDVRAHMHHIQEYEIDQMRELTALLDIELDFVEKYTEVLREVKKEWPSISSVRPATRTNGILPKSKDKKRKPSVRREREKEKEVEKPRSRAASATRSIGTAVGSDEDSDAGDDDETRSAVSRPSSRRSSVAAGAGHHRSDSFGSKSNPNRSRPSSRASRKRADSTAETPKRLSMAGLMGSFSGRGKKKFANLDDDDDGDDARNDFDDRDRDGGDFTASPVQSHRSFGSSASKKGKHTHAHSKSFSREVEKEKERKIVRALHDFNGSSDELSFKAGEEIVVVNEVLEGWWMGEIRAGVGKGKRGLFPVPYTEIVPPKPPLPVRPDLSPRGDSDGDGEDGGGGYKSSEAEDHEVYGSRPLAPDHSPFFGGSGSLPDSASFTSSIVDEDDDHHHRAGPFLQPSLSHTSRVPVIPSTYISASATSSSSLVAIPPRPDRPDMSQKKAPPPPPPRRSTGNLLPAATPPIPPRRPGMASRGLSSSSLSATPASSVSSHDGGYDVSPFDSATELSGTTGQGKSNPF
ncbi:hypothetical protein V5O48_010520 [Marasmius crinis-equi]|uniref:BAR-domain-containing protein n=1 Tax=Marasmius crinis-equi TaxID=585013 RepID=A0ABR3F8S3_9AGAR